MRLIDGHELYRQIPLKVCLPCPFGEEKECKDCVIDNVMKVIDEAPTVAASPWRRVEEPPEPHKKVLVSGMEAINNSRVYKVMVNDNGEWRPKDYAPSILWDYWMPIEPPKEDA